MATFTHGIGDGGEMVEDGSKQYHPQDFTALVDNATVEAIGDTAGEISEDIIQDNASLGGVEGVAADGTPALRTVVVDGTTGVGSHAALGAADLRVPFLSTSGTTANKLKFGSNTAIPLSSTNPTTGYLLKYDGTNVIGVDPNLALTIAGPTGSTVAVTQSSSSVTGTSTLFSSQLHVGDVVNITLAGPVTKQVRVKSITSDTVFVAEASTGFPIPWTAASQSGLAYTISRGIQARPWGALTAVTATTNTALVGDDGQLFACATTTAGGNIAVTLPASSSSTGMSAGANLAFVKTQSDAYTVTITCAGADTFSDGSTSIVLKSQGASVTIVPDGASFWRIVASHRLSGFVIQRVIATDTTSASYTNQIAINAAPTVSDGTKVAALTSTLTPTCATSLIRVTGQIPCSNTTGGNAYNAAAVFSTVAATPTLRNVSWLKLGSSADAGIINISFEFAAGAITAMTIDLYLGPSGSTLRYLLNSANASLYGGAAPNQAWLRVEEIAE